MAAAKIATRLTLAMGLGVLLLSPATGYAQEPSSKPNQQAAGSALTAPATASEIEAAKPNPQAPGFRIPLPPLDQMDPAQRADFERESNTFHTPVGPRVPLELSPEISAANSRMLPALQKSALPQDLFELTILMVSRDWGAQFEWWVHAPQTIKAGVPADVVEAIRVGKMPKFTKPGEEAAYRYLAELLSNHKVSDATYERLRATIGTRQMVEMTVLAGYYSIVAMTLVAHNVPLRSDVTPPLPDLANRFPAAARAAN